MEPPAKRRRMSQLLLDKGYVDENDDELALQPFEVEAKRDPGYKLSIERAFADQRFQATMAHIFDKYGRDFEGIGDEIDLVTGEIVVNNGHVRNMRDEGDVGDGVGEYLGEKEDDEDEGILLEDLFDDEEESGDNDTAEQEGHAAVFGKQIQNNNGLDEDEEDEDRIIQGREAPRESHSTALVLGSSSENASHASRTALRALPHKIPPGNILDLEPIGQLPFSSSPLSFDRSPFAMEPWSLSGQYSDPLWNKPDLFAVHQPKPQQFPMKASRYDFPAQSGQSSIWAPRSKFRDEEDKPLQSVFAATFGKHLLTKTKKVLRHPLLLPPAKAVEDDDKREEEDEDEDEDVILTGKRSKEIEGFGKIEMNLAKRGKRLNVSHPSSETSKELKEKGVEGGSSDSGYKSTQSTRKARKRKQRPDEDLTRNDALVRVAEIPRRAPHLDDEIPSQRSNQTRQQLSTAKQLDEADGRRRSGRMRKQVEFLNKISWADVLAEQRAEKEVAYSRNRNDGQFMVDEDALEKRPVLAAPEEDYIPDSAAEDEEGFEEDEEEESEEIGEKGEKEKEEAKSQTNFRGDLPTLRAKETRQPDIHEESCASIPEVFPRKNADSACLLSDDEAPTLLSKLRKTASNNTLKDTFPLREIHNIKTQTNARVDLPASRKTKKADYSHRENTDTRDVIDDTSPSGTSSSRRLNIPSEDSSGVAPLSSSPTRFLSRITLDVSLDDKPQTSYSSARRSRYRRSADIRSSSPCARMDEDTPEATASSQRRQLTKLATTPIVIDDSSYETSDEISPVESSPITRASIPMEPALPSPRRGTPPPEVVARAIIQSPSKHFSMLPPSSPTKSLSKRISSTHSGPSSAGEAKISGPVTSLPSLSNPPQTPRHSNRHSLKVPSSRHSILSLLSDDEDEEVDELGRSLAAMPRLLSSAARTTERKLWKSSSRTREVYHTPVKKRPTEPISPGSIIKTPGGSLRACGVDGYRCGRDFCFTCL
ncbi:hypothetical protein TGAMA5MH_03579 [Trichoderma gamsii]|uniref:Centromere protein Scm3 n=1 Tax=Trichoderma gamsii TaxID=398673 RepID=A0A2K0TGY5_9HYPO|nr:hypothetical protein TGAMA5MH_03579 [Trichoderma gamsii]